jgi:Cu-Zn family superoxide dismutase
MRALVAAAALVALAGCAASGQDARYMAGHFRAQADLHDAGGTEVGKAAVEEIDGTLRVIVDVAGLPAGEHGVHVHTAGKCDGPDFASAGGHWNPTQHQHGMRNPMGPHAGDLPNLEVDAKGRGQLMFMLPGGSFAGLMDEDGAALVVHAKADDLKTDPSGNSGGRVACGVFEAM